MQDPEQFEADGGWNFLDMEGDSGEEEEESEEGDPEFQGESDEEGASSEDYRCVLHAALSSFRCLARMLVAEQKRYAGRSCNMCYAGILQGV